MKRALITIIVLSALNLFWVGPAQAQRRVEGRTLISRTQPPVRIKFDKDFDYVGTQSFVLYGTAQVEQHFFVDADDSRIRRLFMVQFEGYLPTNTHTYNYQIKETVKLGGLDFMYDTQVANVPNFRKQYPDSDAGRAAAFLEGKGYQLEGMDLVFQRYIRLVDESRRNELLIIYYENLEGTGLTELWDTVLKHRQVLSDAGEFEARRNSQQVDWAWSMVRDTVLDRVLNHPGVRKVRAEVERRVRDGELTPTLAAQQILDAADSRAG